MLREQVVAEKKRNPGGTTAVNCCGANPGMATWLFKQALLNIAAEAGLEAKVPASQKEWGLLAMRLGVKGLHVAERDTQVCGSPKPFEAFWNTWSSDGFISESLQPSELGWGTHEKWMPPSAKRHEVGSKCAIYLDQPGVKTRVRSWCPSPGPQVGFLVTHNEAISISDYFTVKDEAQQVVYRPTCHYAYRPCDQALTSLMDMLGTGEVPEEDNLRVLEADDIASGMDELGVLVYGHERNAYWYGSRLTIEEATRLAPHQNATGLQVTSAVLAGLLWALENPERGIVEAEDLDFQRCLEVQRPYLG
jgi:homospermidine synthase